MRPTAFVPIAATAGERRAEGSAGAATAVAAAKNAPTSTTAVDAMTFPPPLVFKALIFAPDSSRVPAPREDRLGAAAGIEPAYKVLQTSACATRLRRREPPSVSGRAGVAGGPVRCRSSDSQPGCFIDERPSAARARRRSRDHHKRQPGEAQRVRRRDGRAPLRDPERAPRPPGGASGRVARRRQVLLVRT